MIYLLKFNIQNHVPLCLRLCSRVSLTLRGNGTNIPTPINVNTAQTHLPIANTLRKKSGSVSKKNLKPIQKHLSNASQLMPTFVNETESYERFLYIYCISK